MQCNKRQVEDTECVCMRCTPDQMPSLDYTFPLPPLPLIPQTMPLCRFATLLCHLPVSFVLLRVVIT